MNDGPSSAFSALERIASRDVGRGSERLAAHTVGSLERASVSVAQSDRLTVAILTGFFIPGATAPACETDGPIGAVQLAAAVHALGGSARILTDEPCAPVLRAAIAAAEIDAALDVAPLPARSGVSGFNSWSLRLIDEYRSLTHFVSIERPGPSVSGPPRNMRGLDISSQTAPLDRCFEAGPWRKIAIGDGGNEIGMGVLSSDVVAQAVPDGDRIQCVIGCDDLIVGGTSNWASAALVGGISIVETRSAKRILPLLDPSWSRKILRAVVENAGAVDGVRLLPTPTVDGLDWDDYQVPLREIERVVSAVIMRT